MAHFVVTLAFLGWSEEPATSPVRLQASLRGRGASGSPPRPCSFSCWQLSVAYRLEAGTDHAPPTQLGWAGPSPMCPSHWRGWWLASWLGCCLADVAPMILRAHHVSAWACLDHDLHILTQRKGERASFPSASEPTASAPQGTFGNVHTSALHARPAVDRLGRAEGIASLLTGRRHTFLQRLVSGTCSHLPGVRWARADTTEAGQWKRAARGQGSRHGGMGRGPQA